MPPSPRDKLSKAQRVAMVEKAMSLGLSHNQIQVSISKEHKCTLRTIRRDIIEVQDKWALEAESEAPFRRHQTRSLLQDIVLKDTRPEWNDWARERLAMMGAEPTSSDVKDQTQ